MIRIVGGKFKGQKLQVPHGDKVRPTSNKIREAVFNILNHLIDFDDYLVLDLFAGSGALGLEAISRGCSESFLIEANAKHFHILKENASFLQNNATIKTIRHKAERWLPSFSDNSKNCLIFLDPPYQMKSL